MDYMERNKDFYSTFMIENIDEYIDRLRKDGAWGDNYEIQALSVLYNARIEIYHLDRNPILIY